MSRPAAGRAHPRSRGENADLTMEDATALGLIPAHAGKTHPPRDYPRRSRAHPRSRGENLGPARGWRDRLGSSPLTRGKRHPLRPRICDRGLIPAHAGKTTMRRSARRCAKAHPRSRGENPGDAANKPEGAGSSPLTRGKPVTSLDSRQRAGLIPAHAGKTAMSSSIFGSIGAHPRSRGENT